MKMTNPLIAQSCVNTELTERLKILRAERNPYGSLFSASLKAEIRQRDKFMCRRCYKSEKELGRELDCHHINYRKNDSRPVNLVSLCEKCHGKTNFNRWYWKRYYQKKNRRYYENANNQKN